MTLRLHNYNLELLYNKGKEIFASDTLSRVYLTGEHEEDDFDQDVL